MHFKRKEPSLLFSSKISTNRQHGGIVGEVGAETIRLQNV